MRAVGGFPDQDEPGIPATLKQGIVIRRSSGQRLCGLPNGLDFLVHSAPTGSIFAPI
jgi:hypothetical protein